MRTLKAPWSGVTIHDQCMARGLDIELPVSPSVERTFVNLSTEDYKNNTILSESPTASNNLSTIYLAGGGLQ